MASEKIIEIDGKEVRFRASAAIPRQYRNQFGRDIFRDINELSKAVGANEEGASGIDTLSLEIFENVAYVMAKHADDKIPPTPEEWLDEFSTFSIYQVLPQIIALWTENTKTTVDAKKNKE